eukprot:6204802-Pleurochrysis_carterae.AAC.1
MRHTTSETITRSLWYRPEGCLSRLEASTCRRWRSRRRRRRVLPRLALPSTAASTSQAAVASAAALPHGKDSDSDNGDEQGLRGDENSVLDEVDEAAVVGTQSTALNASTQRVEHTMAHRR